MRVSTSPSDAELIARARTGDGRAHHDLRDRHVGAARLLARRLGRVGPGADDLVDEAFALMRADLERGTGPDIAFRAELLATLSRVVARSADRTDAPAIVVSERSGGSGLARAYESLPEHWRAVLWYADIERATPADIEAHLGVTAAEFAALAYRARTLLRQTYLTRERDAEIAESCRLAQDRLESYELDALSSGEKVRVARHLAACSRCRELAAELTDLRGALARAVAPLVLGPASDAYLADAADEPENTANGRSRRPPRQPHRSRRRTSIAVVAVTVLLAGLVTWIVYGASAASVSDLEVALAAEERGELGPSGASTSASDVAANPAEPAVVGQDEPLPDGTPTPHADGDDQDGVAGEAPAGAGSPPAAPTGAAPTNPPAPATPPPPAPTPALPSPPAATAPATPSPPVGPPTVIESTPVAPTPMADLSIEVSGAHHGSHSVAVVVTNGGPHAAASPTVEITLKRLPRSVPPGCEIHHSRITVTCSLGVMGPGDQVGGSIGVVDGSDVRKLRVTSSTLDPVPANNEWSR